MNLDAQLKLPEANPTHDNIYKKMYSISCMNRPKNEYTFSNYVGLILLILIAFGFVMYRKIIRSGGNIKKNKSTIPGIKTFLQNHDIVKLIIGLLLLNHVRELSNSMVSNVIHPLIEPLIPFIQCTFSIKYSDSHIEIGNFITDILIFTINLGILYILYLIMISY